MLDRCVDFIDRVLNTNICAAQELDEFIDGIRPAILENVEAATRPHHRQLSRADGRLALEVDREGVGRDVHRYPGGFLGSEEFCRGAVLRENFWVNVVKGKRIVFAESRFEEEQELQLLGTHLLDTEVGVAFF